MSDFKMIELTVGMVMTNCYIGYNDDTREAFIVDPGDDAGRISRTVREQKLDVKAILLTHGHFDHMMAVPELKAEFGAPVYAGEAEEALLKDTRMNLSAPWVGRPLRLEADRLLADGERFELAGFEIQVIWRRSGYCSAGIPCFVAPTDGWTCPPPAAPISPDPSMKSCCRCRRRRQFIPDMRGRLRLPTSGNIIR